MTLFHVRPATLDDLDTLVSFTLAEAQEAEGLDLVPETVRRGVRAGLEDPAVSRYWLLEGEADGPVGAISIVREWSDWQAATYWWIQSLYLEPGSVGPLARNRRPGSQARRGAGSSLVRPPGQRTSHPRLPPGRLFPVALRHHDIGFVTARSRADICAQLSRLLRIVTRAIAC